MGRPTHCAPGGNCESGIKHYQLCELKDRLALVFAGVMHISVPSDVDQKINIFITPLSGRWANIKYDLLNDLSNSDPSLVGFTLSYLAILRNQPNGDLWASMFLDMYMTRLVKLRLEKLWINDTRKFAIHDCHDHIAMECLIDHLTRSISMNACGKDVVDAYGAA